MGGWGWVSTKFTYHTYQGVLGESPTNLPQGAWEGASALRVYLGVLDVCPAQFSNYPRVLGNALLNLPVLAMLVQYPDHLPRSAAAPPIYLSVRGECLFPTYLGMLGKRPAHSSHLFPAAGNNVEDARGEASQLREGGQGEG